MRHSCPVFQAEQVLRAAARLETGSPVFADSRPMYCYGQPISLTWHGPHPAVGDMNGDGKPDLLCYTEWSVYAFYSHVAIETPQRPTYTLGTPLLVSTAPDFDFDDDVDQEDFGFLQGCMEGSYDPIPPGCEAADLNHDAHIDDGDFAVFAACHAGADVPIDLACVPE